MAEIHTHPIGSPSTPASEILHQALAILRPRLPTSIPLYRRLQFHASFTENSLLLTNLDLNSNASQAEPWLIGFLDRSRRPETELWLYGSWESASSLEQDERATALLHALLSKIKSLSIPRSIHTSAALELAASKNEDPSGVSRAEYAAHSQLDPSEILLCGAIHSTTTEYLHKARLLRTDLGTASGKAKLTPNHHYYFKVDEIVERLGASIDELPAELRWGQLSEAKHWALVKSRTQIPRQERTLAQLPNLAIFPTTGGEGAEPIAWAFVGIDASLTSLHVEPDWRGKGLAKKIMIKLFKDKMDMFWEEGVTRWAHDFVIEGNVASVAVSDSVGGKSEGVAYWLRADLSKV